LSASRPNPHPLPRPIDELDARFIRRVLKKFPRRRLGGTLNAPDAVLKCREVLKLVERFLRPSRYFLRPDWLLHAVELGTYPKPRAWGLPHLIVAAAYVGAAVKLDEPRGGIRVRLRQRVPLEKVLQTIRREVRGGR
jgi:hypothetical protein